MNKQEKFFRDLIQEISIEKTPILKRFFLFVMERAKKLPEKAERKGIPRGDPLLLPRKKFYLALCQFLDPQVNLKKFAEAMDVSYGVVKNWSMEDRVCKESLSIALSFAELHEAHLRMLFSKMMEKKPEESEMNERDVDFGLVLDSIIVELACYKNVYLMELIVAGWIGIIRKDPKYVKENYSKRIRTENPLYSSIGKKTPKKWLVHEDDIYNSIFIFAFAKRLFRIIRVLLPPEHDIGGMKVRELEGFLWESLFAQLSKLIRVDTQAALVFTGTMRSEIKCLMDERDAWRQEYYKKGKRKHAKKRTNKAKKATAS